MQQSLNSPYQLKIIKADTRSDVVYYYIQVLNTLTKMSWSFEERYKNMYNLHSALSSETKTALPQFPAKKFFGNTDPEFISTRKAGLQNYFKTLLQIIDVEQSPTLKKFLTQGEQKQIRDQAQTSSFKEENIKPIEQTNNKQQQQKVTQQKQQDNERYKREIKDKLNIASNQVMSRFVDLGNQVNPPEEQEIRRKRQYYDQVRIDPKAIQINIDIPKSNPGAKSMIASPTIATTDFKLMETINNLFKGVEQILAH